MTSPAARVALELTADLPVPSLEEFYRDLHRPPPSCVVAHGATRTASRLGASGSRRPGSATADGSTGLRARGTGVAGVLRQRG
ncbi:hypothetical protein [Streptomyces shaanxiensis]